MHTTPPPLIGTVYKVSNFIYNDKTSSGNTIFDGNVDCTRGRGPSPADVEILEVVLVLPVTQAL
jgi:hypothetical protein